MSGPTKSRGSQYHVFASRSQGWDSAYWSYQVWDEDDHERDVSEDEEKAQEGDHVRGEP